jgi:hypothetical protein
MRVRRHWRRVGGGLLAALYLAFPAGVAGVRPCPHHAAAGPDHGHGAAADAPDHAAGAHEHAAATHDHAAGAHEHAPATHEHGTGAHEHAAATRGHAAVAHADPASAAHAHPAAVPAAAVTAGGSCAGHGQLPTDGSAPPGEHDCNCVGTCAPTPGAVPALPSGGALLRAPPPASAQPSAPPADATPVRPHLIPHARPYALAPPPSSIL